MKLESPAFKHNSAIPERYTCDGLNVSPPLLISDVPANAKSLVLINDDPDAPAGIWIHWTLWNIHAATAEIPENSIPRGCALGTTSFGNIGYGGPCPPSGTHRYFFKLYALDTVLKLAPGSSIQELESAIKNHSIAETELIGLYGRG